MENKNNLKKINAFGIKKGWNAFLFSFSFPLLLFYLTMSFLFLFTDAWFDIIPQYRILIGLIILGFAVLRFYISYNRFKNKRVKIENKAVSKKVESSENINV